MVSVEILPQLITDKQVKAHFVKFDFIDAYNRNDYLCKFTFATIKGAMKVLEEKEHIIDGHKVYARAVEPKVKPDLIWDNKENQPMPLGNQLGKPDELKMKQLKYIQWATKMAQSKKPNQTTVEAVKIDENKVVAKKEEERDSEKGEESLTEQQEAAPSTIQTVVNFVTRALNFFRQ